MACSRNQRELLGMLRLVVLFDVVTKYGFTNTVAQKRNFSNDFPRFGKSRIENIASFRRSFGAAEDNEHEIGHSWFSRE